MCQLFRLADDPKEPFENYTKLVVQFAARMVSVLIQIDSWIYGDNKKTFMNQIFLLNRNLKVRQGSNANYFLNVILQSF